MKRSMLVRLVLAGAGALVPLASAQQDMPSRVSMSFNRYSTYAQIETQLKAIAAAYPDLVTLTPIGTSHQGRTLWVVTVNPKKSGPDTAKPAMWIDGNVHGNEIQAAEAVTYTLWYLTKSYGVNPQLTALMDRCAFYLCPSANPDGRENWFSAAHTPDSSRHNIRPFDDDQDGLIDEDPDDDLDGDGSITQMWKADPTAPGPATRRIRGSSGGLLRASAASGRCSAKKASTTTATGGPTRTASTPMT
jgi:hypothetical protein